MSESKYTFLNDKEALSFVITMTGELREIAEDRDWRSVMRNLGSAEQTARAMKHIEASME